MKKNPLTAAIAAFREAPILLHIETIDKRGEAVLKRLECREDIVQAFASIPPDKWRWILHDAIMAERVSRARKSQNQPNSQDEARKARRALAKIKKYLGADGDDAIEAVARAISIREDSEAFLPRKGGEASARALGIGWIKSSVARACGRPNLGSAAVIAEAALDMGDITIDAIRKAPTPEEAFERGLRRRKNPKWLWQISPGRSTRKNLANAP